MRKILLIFMISLAFTGFVNSQNFKTHKVKKGETIETIAKQYHVTAFDIYALNPDAKKRLSPDSMLIIPFVKAENETAQNETRELIGYETHKVRRKETLYSISKEYNIEIEDLKKHNKQLYSENLKKGDKIRIPKYKTVITKVTVTDNALKKYKIQPKEGKWRVAYKFNMTVPELEALNPDMGEVLQPGDEINVPNKEPREEKIPDSNVGYYEVLPKEGYYRLKIKLGLTQEELEKLNPELKEVGLKEGMVLKVPKTIMVGAIEGDVKSTVLSHSIKNLKTKRIALMLPFKLNKIDIDSMAEAMDIVKSDKIISVSLDFHSGVLMALDSAKQLGISTNLKVFDTRNQPSEISKILNSNDFSKYDAVIGPMMTSNFDKVASELKGHKIPVISPLMKPTNLYENVFQTIPSDEMLTDAMIKFVKKVSLDANVVVISDNSNRTKSNQILSEFPLAKQVYSRKNKEGKEGFYINAADIENLLKNGKNYVFLETTNAGLILNAVSLLNGMNSIEKKIILVTTNKSDAFENQHLSNYHLSNLNFHYPSINKSFDSEKPNGFVKKYKALYKVEPNKYAVRGFDLTLDVLLRLASEDDLYLASRNDIETEYLENKFRYNNKMFGGYYNESVYILQYHDLVIEEAQ